jgi:hypothetical protein
LSARLDGALPIPGSAERTRLIHRINRRGIPGTAAGAMTPKRRAPTRSGSGASGDVAMLVPGMPASASAVAVATEATHRRHAGDPPDVR